MEKMSKPEPAQHTLFIFTNEYPYGTGESFIENELVVLSEKFSAVYMLPLYKRGEPRSFPVPNIRLVHLFENSEFHTARAFFKNIFSIPAILLKELFRSENKLSFLRSIRKQNSVLVKNFAREEILVDFLGKTKAVDPLYYSFWTDDWATVLSVAKEKKHIPEFFSRVHGYDLYRERWPEQIIPFRHFQLRNVKAIYAVSKDGQHYLQRNYPAYASKFRLSHLSTFDKGIAPFHPDGVFTIVTCARLDPLKRIPLLAEALKNISFPVRWVHFGDGADMQRLRNAISTLPANITAELRGYVPTAALLDFYGKNTVNLVVNLSVTEGGVPLALQEAASFGIPLLATAAGGSVEIVNERTGILLPVDLQLPALIAAIAGFKDSERNTAEFRKGVRGYWKAAFNAELNYRNFYNSIVYKEKN